MFGSKINEYLRAKNKELEKQVARYAARENAVETYIKHLAELEKEYNEDIVRVKESQAEYDTIIRDVKILRAELLRAKKGKESDQ